MSDSLQSILSLGIFVCPDMHGKFNSSMDSCLWIKQQHYAMMRKSITETMWSSSKKNMKDTFLDDIFLDMRLRSDEIFIGAARGVIKTPTTRKRVGEDQWDHNSSRPSKKKKTTCSWDQQRQRFFAAISNRAGVCMEENHTDFRVYHELSNETKNYEMWTCME